jgi:hypothetical protein
MLEQPSRIPALDLVSITEELDIRGANTQYNYTQLHKLFSQARFLDQARTIYQRHHASQMDLIPEIVDLPLDDNSPSMLVVDDEKNALVRQIVDLRGRGHIIVVSHPQCHFSANAAEAIARDPLLAKIFHEFSIWLAPASSDFDVSRLQRWNRLHPVFKTSISYRHDKWPMITRWATPNFYFVVDEKVVAVIEGWPVEGRRTELLSAAKKAGML